MYSCCKLEIACAYCGWTFEDSFTNFVTFSFAASTICDAFIDTFVLVVVLSFDFLFSEDISDTNQLAQLIYIDWYQMAYITTYGQ